MIEGRAHILVGQVLKVRLTAGIFGNCSVALRHRGRQVASSEGNCEGKLIDVILLTSCYKGFQPICIE